MAKSRQLVQWIEMPNLASLGIGIGSSRVGSAIST